MEATKILLKNCKAILNNIIYEGDVLINNGKIEQIGKLAVVDKKNTEVIDIQWKYLLPGGIDPHVHFHLPTPAGYSCDDFESGSLAAIAGGTTTIIDFVTPSKGENFAQALEKRKLEAKNSLVDYTFHVSPTWWGENSDLDMQHCLELGITSFKVYLAYKGTVGISDEILLKVMDTAKKIGAVVTVHCEDGDMINYLQEKHLSQNQTTPFYHFLSRPEIAETESIRKVIAYAKITGCPVYIVHVSSRTSIDLIAEAQKSGLCIYAETCPQYLVLNSSVYQGRFELTAPYVISPPIREIEHQKNLWSGINRRFIHTIGSDHCPFNLVGQKDIGKDNFTLIPNGAGGVEHRLSLLHHFGYDLNFLGMIRLAEITSFWPAKIFGLDYCKGSIKEGFDADLVVFDPHAENLISSKTHVQKCDTNIYEGITTKGSVKMVFIKGKLVYKDGEFFTEGIQGQFIARNANFNHNHIIT